MQAYTESRRREARPRAARVCAREGECVGDGGWVCGCRVRVVLEVESVAAAVGIDTVGLLYGLCLWGCMLPMLARVLTVLTDA